MDLQMYICGKLVHIREVDTGWAIQVHERFLARPAKDFDSAMRLVAERLTIENALSLLNEDKGGNRGH